MKKMKTLTLFLSLLFSLPFVLSAQMVGETLQKVSAALDNRQWDQAVTLFRQAVNTNVEKAEMFYWTGVDKSLEVSSRIGRELAAYYKKSRSYDKAYLFYKELLQKSPNDVNCLVSCAEMEVCRGRESEALETYRKVLSLDADALQRGAPQPQPQLFPVYHLLTPGGGMLRDLHGPFPGGEFSKVLS